LATYEQAIAECLPYCRQRFRAPDDGFLSRAAALVRRVPPARFPQLSPAEAELASACRPGQVLLGRAA